MCDEEMPAPGSTDDFPAVEVGSVDTIISAAQLHPAIIDAIEDGLRR
jgi:hypothetical protein